VFFYKNRFIPPLKHMTDLVVSTIEFLCINASKLSHAGGKIGIRGFNQHMVMIVHQAVTVTTPVILLNNIAEDTKKLQSVRVITENRRTCIPSRRQMIHRPRIFYS